MLFHHIALLALVQAITEFLPISSSGHLILLHNYLEQNGMNAQYDRLMDISVHIGTLCAVLLYFRRDVATMLKGLLDVVRTRKLVPTPEARMGWLVLTGSIPMLVVGGLIYLLVNEKTLTNPAIIVFTTVIFGILLGVADKIGPKTRSVADLTWKDAIIIGCLQCLSSIPGTSRSGITMTGARLLGFSRPEAARFSFLLAIVATAAVGVMGIFGLSEVGDPVLIRSAIIAAGLTFVFALIVIAVLMKWLAKFSFMPFVVYRLCLGAVLGYLLFIKA